MAADSTFDRDQLHDLMSAIPPGRWTTYGELAGRVGTIGRALGSHVRACEVCPNAWRVLEEGGVPSPSFKWIDPSDTRTPREVLEDEGVGFAGNAAELHRRIDIEELLALVHGSTIPWPTVEWVKAPVFVEGPNQGLPNGDPIAMRHFNDCLHWFRDPDGSFMGEDPRLATDEEMRQLKPCADCAKKAKRFGNDPVGPRLREITLAGLEAVPMPSSMLELEATDDNAIIRVRREQGYLRAKLLNGRAEGECSLCGSGLPASLLIAAHIYPRHKLNDAERLDFNSAAMLACGLGCDALFELGYLTVDATGHVAAQRQVQGDALEAAVERLVGRKVSIHSSTTAANFERHRQLHA